MKFSITNYKELDIIILEYTDYLIKWNFKLEYLHELYVHLIDNNFDVDFYWDSVLENDHIPDNIGYKYIKEIDNFLESKLQDLLRSHESKVQDIFNNNMANPDNINDQLLLPTIYYMCQNKNAPFKFLDKYAHYLNNLCWMVIASNKNTPVWFLKKHINDIYKCGAFNIKNSAIPFSFIENYVKCYINNNQIIEKLCSNKNITTEFLENYIDIWINNKVCIDNLCANTNLSFSFLQKYIDMWINVEYRVRSVCRNKNITTSFLENHIDKWVHDKICIEHLCANKSISFSFLEKFIDKWIDNTWCFEFVCRTKNIPTSFIEKYIHKIINKKSFLSAILYNKYTNISVLEKYIINNSYLDINVKYAMCDNRNTPISYYKSIPNIELWYHYLFQNPSMFIRNLKKEEIIALM